MNAEEYYNYQAEYNEWLSIQEMQDKALQDEYEWEAHQEEIGLEELFKELGGEA